MASVKLVTAGDDVKVWNGTELEVQFSPAPETSTVCWSPDGHFLATSSATGDSVTVSHHKCLTATVELRTNVAQNFVRFGNTSSRTVVTCGNHSDILVWNLKSRTLQKKINSTLKSVNCVAFNGTDTHVACGSSKGEVVLVNAASSVCNPVMKRPNTKSICSLAFSSIAKSQLGALSDESGFNLWDANTRKLIHAYESKHIAPATAFAFSPVNDKLAVSVGLDKRIVFHDLTQKKIFMSTVLDEPITCLDFMDGMNLTLGTVTGKLQFYDLRASITKQTIVAHQSAVNSLHYRKCTTVIKNNELSWNEPAHMAAAAKVASPKPAQHNGAVAGRNPFDESMQVFSPLQSSGVILLEPRNDSPLNLMNVWPQSNAGDTTNTVMVDGNCTSMDVTAAAARLASPTAKMDESDNSDPALEVTVPPPISPAPLAVQQPVMNAIAAPSLDLSHLRSVILDVMEQLSESVHRDIVNLHVDMIKKFQLQQTYFEKRMEQMSHNEELLMAEIERLRAEIQRLRMNV